MAKKNKTLYRGYSYQQSESNQSKRAEEIRRDKFVWKVGYWVIGIVSIIGCYAIYWASTSSY